MTHHHHGGEAHPAPALSASVLRFSGAQRLTVAAMVIAVIWAAVLWAVW